MLCNFKFSVCLFLISIFVFSASAQTIVKNAGRSDTADESFVERKTIVEKDDSPVEREKGFASRNDVSADEEKTDEPQKSYGLKRGDKAFQLEYGISPFNPSNFAGPKEFDVYGRHLHLFSFRFGRIIGTKRNVSYQYTFGATPLAVFTKNEVVNRAYVSPTATPNVSPTKRETTYGAGFQPVDFKFMFLAKNRLKPYAQTGAGILFVSKAVPVPRSTLLQFTGDFGGGLMYMLTPEKALSFGYKYFHISNGNINGKINNPGFNANVFYVNYSYFWNRK